MSSMLLLSFPCGSASKEFACNERDLVLIPGLGRSPGEGKGYPLQYSGLENSMDCIDQGVAKSQTGLRDFHFHVVINVSLYTTYFFILQLILRCKLYLAYRNLSMIYLLYLFTVYFAWNLLYFLNL